MSLQSNLHSFSFRVRARVRVNYRKLDKDG